MKQKMTLGLAMLFTAVLITSAMPTPVKAEEIDIDLGPITHYNGLIFNYFESVQSDVEGALAVGGESKIGTSGQYDVGAAHEDEYYPNVQIGIYKNPDGHPTLLLGGKTQVGHAETGGNVNIYGGPVILNEDWKDYYEQQCAIQFSAAHGVHYHACDPVAAYFNEAYNQAMVASLNLSAQSGPEVDMSTFLAGSYSAPSPESPAGDDASILVVTVQSETDVQITGPNLPSAIGNAFDLVVFNFPNAQTARFSGGSVMIDNTQINTSAPAAMPGQHQLLSTYAQKIIWNFPAATDIETSAHGIVGSLLAPNARLEATGGSLNGMLIADSFITRGGMELHAFRMRDSIFELEGEGPLGDMVLLKVDAQDASVLEGAQFRLDALIDEEWQPYAADLYTDENGLLYVTGLPYGSYRLVEIAPPAGYRLPEEPVFPFIINDESGGDSTLLLEVENTRLQAPTTDMVLTKVDMSQQPIEGAGFLLYRVINGEMHELGTIESDAQGTLALMGLEEGEYHLVELQPLPGFEVVPGYEVVRIVVVPGESGLVATVSNNAGEMAVPYEIPNRETDNPGNRVIIRKLDYDEPDIALPGVLFDLYLESAGEWQLVLSGLQTDEYGIISLDNVADGNYRLVETDAPAGYWPADLEKHAGTDYYYISYFTVESGQAQNDDHVVPLEPNEEDEKLSEEPPDMIELPPQDDENDEIPEPLEPDIEKSKNDSDGESDTDLPELVSLRLTADIDNKVAETEVEEAETEKAETHADESDEPVVPIEDEDDTALSGEGTEQQDDSLVEAPKAVLIHTVYNKKDAGGFQLHKTDSQNGEALAGAHFLLLWVQSDGDRKFIAEFSTGADGVFAMGGLSPGNYELVEIAAPHGYELLAAPVSFTIGSGDGNVIDLQVSNDPIRGGVAIVKRDGNTQAPLAGAVFTLYRQGAQGEWGLHGTTVQTDTNGITRVDNLPAGSYMLIETTAPGGYSLADQNYYFTIAGQGQNTLETGRVTVYNFPIDPNEPRRIGGGGEDGLSAAGQTEYTLYSAPQTGDDTSIWGWVTLAGISGILITGGIWLLLRRRRA